MCQKKEGRGLANIEDCIDASIQGPGANIKKGKENLITAVSNSIGKIRTDKK